MLVTFKDNFLRGAVILLPFILVTAVFGLAFAYISPVAVRLQQWLFPSAMTVVVPFAVTVVAMALVIGLVGWFGNSESGFRLQRRLDQQIGQIVPTYAVVRQLLRDFSGGSDHLTGREHEKVVLVRTDELELLGLLIEERADGRFVVFVPDAPSGLTGSVMLVQAEFMSDTTLTARDLMMGLRRLGADLPDMDVKR